MRKADVEETGMKLQEENYENKRKRPTKYVFILWDYIQLSDDASMLMIGKENARHYN